MELIPAEETQRRLRIVGQTYRGAAAIPVARIVGSLDRSADFDRNFRPRHGFSQTRLASLRAAFPDGRLPPIEVQEIGGAYFVSDGHHRVALARELGAEFIDADVTALHTNYEIGVDVDVRQLVHTEQQRIFLDESGLGRARPRAVVEFSRPGGYGELLEIVKAHSYDVIRRHGSLLAPAETAADWYDSVYLPGVSALRREALPQAYTYKTDADLFLWIYQRRRALQVFDPASGFDAAARDARAQRVSRSFRRAFLREKSRPLLQRSDRDD